MSLVQRRFLAYGFIAAFVVIAPILILYAAGYRLRDNRFEKTGTLVVSTIPRGAMIRLNNTTLEQTTPATVTALTPGEYTVTLELDGYFPWSKRFAIEADRAVFASDVQLFKKFTPELIRPGATTVLSKSQSGDRALVLVEEKGKQSFGLLAGISGAITMIPAAVPSDIAAATIEWSPLEDAFLYVTPTRAAAHWFDGSRNVNLSELMKTNIAHWGTTASAPITISDGARVADVQWTAAPRLDSINTELPANTSVTDVWRRGAERIEIWKTPNQVSRVARYSGASEPTIHELPSGRSYRFVDSFTDILLLIDESKQITSWRLVNGSLLPLATIDNVQHYDLDRLTQELTYATPFEVWTYSTRTGSRDLLTRLEKTITGVRGYPRSSHVFFISNNAAYAIERDGRDVRNRWELGTMDDLTSLLASPDGKRLWLFSSGSQAGLYRLNLE